MRERAQGNRSRIRASARAPLGDRPPWRRAEFWVAVGGLLALVLLNHLTLLTAPGRDQPGLGDTLAAFRTEFPNPFYDGGLYGSWGGGGTVAMVILHLVGTLGAGFFLLRLTRDRVAALAGAALYGVHPLHVALFAQGTELGLAAAPIAFFGAGLLAFGRVAARLAGAGIAAAGVLLDPTLVLLPVFLVLLRILAPQAAPPRGAVRVTAIGSLVGAAAALLAGWRAWPSDRLSEQWLPPGPPLPEPMSNLVLTAGRALQHLYSAIFSGIDYGRGEVATTWTWSDPGAAWLVLVGAAALVAVLAARGPRGGAAAARSPGIGLPAVVGVGSFLLPLPALLVLLHTERGFFAGSLLVAAVLPGLLLATAVSGVLGVALGPRTLRRLAAAVLALAVVVPASYATFRDAPRVKTAVAALKSARAVSERSYPLRRRYLAMRVLRNHNKLELQQRYRAFTAAHPWDARAWDDVGRFDWVIRRFPDAVDAWTRALSIEPRSESFRYSLAAAQLMARRFDAAVESARMLPRRVPEVAALQRLACARAGRPLPFTAEDAQRAAAIVLRAQGMILTEAGRYRDGLGLLERAAGARPDDALIAAYRGWCLLELGEQEAALDILRFDALVNESGWLAHKILGDFYLAEGPNHSRREAYHHYAYFVQYDRGHPAVPGILKLLQQMQVGER